MGTGFLSSNDNVSTTRGCLLAWRSATTEWKEVGRVNCVFLLDKWNRSS